MSDFSPAIYLVFGLRLLLLILAWILLPFILMNTNSYLRKLVWQQERTNALLEKRLPDLSRRQ